MYTNIHKIFLKFFIFTFTLKFFVVEMQIYFYR